MSELFFLHINHFRFSDNQSKPGPKRRNFIGPAVRPVSTNDLQMSANGAALDDDMCRTSGALLMFFVRNPGLTAGPMNFRPLRAWCCEFKIVLRAWSCEFKKVLDQSAN
jgi:hypothetical protein